LRWKVRWFGTRTTMRLLAMTVQSIEERSTSTNGPASGNARVRKTWAITALDSPLGNIAVIIQVSMRSIEFPAVETMTAT
jgi:hypothetical protein